MNKHQLLALVLDSLSRRKRRRSHAAILAFAAVAVSLSAGQPVNGQLNAPDNWYVLCNPSTGQVGLGKRPFPVWPIHKQMSGPHEGEPAVRAWMEANCPSWRCDQVGRCVAGPTAVVVPPTSDPVGEAVTPRTWTTFDCGEGVRVGGVFYRTDRVNRYLEVWGRAPNFVACRFYPPQSGSSFSLSINWYEEAIPDSSLPWFSDHCNKPGRWKAVPSLTGGVVSSVTGRESGSDYGDDRLFVPTSGRAAWAILGSGTDSLEPYLASDLLTLAATLLSKVEPHAVRVPCARIR